MSILSILADQCYPLLLTSAATLFLQQQTQRSTPVRSGDFAENRKQRLFLPETEHQLQSLLADYPDACLWASGTDLGLTITQSMETAAPLIYLHRVQGEQTQGRRYLNRPHGPAFGH